MRWTTSPSTSAASSKRSSSSSWKHGGRNEAEVRRRLFGELTEGFKALAAARAGKVTLRTHTVKPLPAPKIGAVELVKVRRQLRLSRPVFAAYLRTNVRTLENWEQGRAKPNAQAVLLIKMVQKFPDTVSRLATI